MDASQRKQSPPAPHSSAELCEPRPVQVKMGCIFGFFRAKNERVGLLPLENPPAHALDACSRPLEGNTLPKNKETPRPRRCLVRPSPQENKCMPHFVAHPAQVEQILLYLEETRPNRGRLRLLAQNLMHILTTNPGLRHSLRHPGCSPGHLEPKQGGCPTSPK